MKQNYLKLLMLCLLSFAGMSAYAAIYDCIVNGIYYYLNTEDNTARVANINSMFGNFSGTLDIPESIVYNGVTYTVTAIDRAAFYGCSGLTAVTIPNSVTSIGEFAFNSCSGLAKLTIPNSVTSIGDAAFAWCSGLTELTIPNSVTSIGDAAFAECSGLERIMVEEDNLYYDSREDCNAIIRTGNNKLVAGCKNTHIPNSVTSIGDDSFNGCNGLTELTIPNSVTSIGDYAFFDCSGLTKLTIPNSVTSIGDYAFFSCSGLTKLTIGNSVTSIGSVAFYECTSLLSVTSLNPVPPTIKTTIFEDEDCFDYATYQNATLHVPTGSKEAYQQADYWEYFYNIEEGADTGIGSITADKQGKTVIYTLDGKRLSTTNTAELPKGIYIVNGKKMVVK